MALLLAPLVDHMLTRITVDHHLKSRGQVRTATSCQAILATLAMLGVHNFLLTLLLCAGLCNHWQRMCGCRPTSVSCCGHHVSLRANQVHRMHVGVR